MCRTRLIVLILLLLPAFSYAGDVNLPKTGQKTCYNDDGENVIDCTDTGQDGDIQAGVVWPSPRFEDNGNGTVTDNLTGLMWLKDANCLGNRNWQSAFDVIANFNTNPGNFNCTEYTANYTDWILPNIIELESLVNLDEPDPEVWLNTQGFTNTIGAYWSSTKSMYPGSAWILNMLFGTVFYSTTSGDNLYVWPVRSGHSGPAKVWQTGQTYSYVNGDDGNLQRGVNWPSPRFKDNNDGTVTDHLTGLVWLKNANCGGAMNWNNALNFSNNLAEGTCGLTDGSVSGDWRLPNRKELISLVDYSVSHPSLPVGHLFQNVEPKPSTYFWSSSTKAGHGQTYDAWCVVMNYGFTTDVSKLLDLYAWPVRSGSNTDSTSELKAMPWILLLLLDN